jgi:hypothetical protein
MANDIKYIELYTWNRKMILMHGDKLTPIQKAIGRRSNGLHTEIRFSDRYGRISFSCTLADGANGCRFKMIGYSHPYRQSRVRIPVTADQEARLFAKACEMADTAKTLEVITSQGKTFGEHISSGGLFSPYGPNAIKYDKWYATFGFISKWKIWGEHKDMMICNEAVANDMLEVWPDLLVVDEDYFESKRIIGNTPPKFILDSFDHKDPATLTPDQFEYLVRHYFERNGDRT